jgi:hypothetical protein
MKISERASPSYTGKTDFFDKIDSLPGVEVPIGTLVAITS